MRGSSLDSRGFLASIGGRVLTLAAALAALTGCASMGGEGYTRAATARALGLAPGDVIIVSRSYNETGPDVADLALANYTVLTSDGYTYICDPHTKAGAPDAPVCKRKPR